MIRRIKVARPTEMIGKVARRAGKTQRKERNHATTILMSRLILAIAGEKRATTLVLG